MKEKTHETLKKHKCGKYNSITNFFGMLKDLSWKAKEKQMKDLRDSFDRK